MIAVIVCTRNRPASLATCLESIGACTYPVGRVVVGDDGKRSETESVVERFRDRLPRLTVVEGPRRGLSANRNACVDAVQEQYVLFLDDDARLDPSFLRVALDAAGPRLLVTGHEWRDRTKVLPYGPDFLGFLRAPVPAAPVSIVINSTVFPADFLRRTPFDESYRFGSEEADIAFAARAAGLRIRYVDAGNHHDHDPASREGNTGEAIHSKAYFGAKRYLRYERRPLRFVAFAVWGVANAVGHWSRRSGGRAGLRAGKDFVKGLAGGVRNRPRRRDTSGVVT